jgi:NAD(P)-dependent dehydrogenase (short-subunit alcohol dehydrogenase family)
VGLEGRTALVTGAAHGIGRVTAHVLAEAGARVAVADRDPSVEDTAQRLRDQGAESLAAVFDVAAADEVRAAVARLAGALGPIDVLVSNAAIVDHIAPVTRMQVERWERELAVNLGGAFHLVQAVLPGMAERRWGRIVVISSLAARGGLRLQAGYAASKSGLIGLAQTVALEHARDGVTCNAILPGLIETENVARMPAEIRASVIARTPAQRLGTMEEVAQLVAFLVSDAAGFINGAEIRIDGGASLNSDTLGSRREQKRSGG